MEISQQSMFLDHYVLESIVSVKRKIILGQQKK